MYFLWYDFLDKNNEFFFFLNIIDMKYNRYEKFSLIWYKYEKYFTRLKNIHTEGFSIKRRQETFNQFSEINETWSTSGLLNSCNRTLVNTKDTHATSHMYVCVLTNRERTERLFRSRAVTTARQGRRNQTEANQTNTRRCNVIIVILGNCSLCD